MTRALRPGNRWKGQAWRGGLLCVAALMLVLAAASATASSRYDPRLRFRVIHTPHFSIYFHQGEEAHARRLAAMAEEVRRALTTRLGLPPASRTHVVLVDQVDRSNGWATPLPYNTIELAAVWPSGREPIGNLDDWLRLVFTHEYTHILHLDAARGWIGGLRKVFGRAPPLFPNVFLPQWQIEGLATYAESAVTGRGRVHAGDFATIVDLAARRGVAEPLDRANGGLVAWPGGTTPYAYGAFFHAYLAERFGEPSLAALARETSGLFPYFGHRAFPRVFGESLGNLWRDFERARATAAEDEPFFPATPTRLTHHGYDVSAPRAFTTVSSDGRASSRIAYLLADAHDFPTLRSVATDGSDGRRLTTSFAGNTVGAGRGLLIFDQLEIRRNVAWHGDLYAFDPERGRTLRLTHEARLVEPDISQDGRMLAAVRVAAEGRSLVVFDLRPDRDPGGPGWMDEQAPRVSRLEPGTQYATPRFSPDGRSVVAERRHLQGASELVRVDLGSGAISVLARSISGRMVTPAWSPDGKHVVFAWDRDGGAFDLYAMDAAVGDDAGRPGAIRRLTRLPGGALWPAFTPDGRRLVFVGYTTEGRDLFSMPVDAALWEAVEAGDARPGRQSAAPVIAAAEAPQAAEAAPPEGQEPEPRTYSPLATLWPRFWVPYAEANDDEVKLGATTAGVDVLGRHAYSASVFWPVARSEDLPSPARPDVVLAYTYDRWRPAFFAAFSDTSEVVTGDSAGAGRLRVVQREQQLETGVLVPVVRVRRVQAWRAGLAFDRIGFSDMPPTVERHAVRLAWMLGTAKTYGYSISPEQGVLAGVTSEHVLPGLGADGRADAFTAEARAYLRLGGRHSVLALRGAAGGSRGEDRVRRSYLLGGSTAGGIVNFDSDGLALLRGFTTNGERGSALAAMNAEFRLPIAFVERGRGTWPLFLRAIHATAFVDAATIKSGTRAPQRDARAEAWSPLRASVGAELGLDVVAGYALPLTASLGVAWPVDAAHRGSRPSLFVRLGRAF